MRPATIWASAAFITDSTDSPCLFYCSWLSISGYSQVLEIALFDLGVMSEVWPERCLIGGSIRAN
jgi:hypothetical protein